MDSIKKLQDLFSRFPTVGKRTASRFVYYLINQPKENVDAFVSAVQELKSTIKLCEWCFNPFEGIGVSETPMLCEICANPSHNKSQLCIIEKEADLNSIENTKRYKGLYFILGGVVSSFKPDASVLRLEALKQRLSKTSVEEVIIALNPTPEGKATAILVERTLREYSSSQLQSSKFKVTHLAQGLPVGGELEYADEETLESAFDGRK